MAQGALRRGLRVYAGDGTYVGRVLQCEPRFIVIGRTRWTGDHLIVPNEEVAATARDVVLLRRLPDSIRSETAEPWMPPADPIGNANGIDLEPLRAGMAEVEDSRVGTSSERSPRIRRDDLEVLDRAAPLPSAEDAARLERARVERLEANTERAIRAEIEDLEIEAACVVPAGFEAVARYEELLEWTAREGRRQERVRWPRAPDAAAPQSRETVAAAQRDASEAAREVARNPSLLTRVLRDAGFTWSEAGAIAFAAPAALAALRRNPEQTERPPRPSSP